MPLRWGSHATFQGAASRPEAGKNPAAPLEMASGCPELATLCRDTPSTSEKGPWPWKPRPPCRHARNAERSFTVALPMRAAGAWTCRSCAGPQPAGPACAPPASGDRPKPRDSRNRPNRLPTRTGDSRPPKPDGAGLTSCGRRDRRGHRAQSRHGPPPRRASVRPVQPSLLPPARIPASWARARPPSAAA